MRAWNGSTNPLADVAGRAFWTLSLDLRKPGLQIAMQRRQPAGISRSIKENRFEIGKAIVNCQAAKKTDRITSQREQARPMLSIGSAARPLRLMLLSYIHLLILLCSRSSLRLRQTCPRQSFLVVVRDMRLFRNFIFSSYQNPDSSSTARHLLTVSPAIH
jgi:hypothetical protein